MINLTLFMRRWVLAVVFTTWASQAATAQTDWQVDALNDKLNRLERDLQDVQRELYFNSGRAAAVTVPEFDNPSAAAVTVPEFDIPSAAARATVRINELDATIRRLTGQIEELNFRVTQLSIKMETLSGDADFRFRSLEQATGVSSSGFATSNSTVQTLGTTQPSQLPLSGAAPTVNAIPPAVSVMVGEQSFNTTVRTANAPQSLGILPATNLPGTAAEQYEAAKERLMDGDFSGAEVAFANFLESHSDDELAGEAQYWLGEVFYVRGAYQEAGRAFADGLTNYPNSVKGPNTLLKLGMSLTALDQRDAACTTFGELDRRYPDASKTIVQRVKVERTKAGCS